MIPRAARVVFRDVTIFEPQFAVADLRIRLTDVGFALAQRLYFGAAQHHARLEPLQKLIMVVRSAVLSHHLLGATLLRLAGAFVSLLFLRFPRHAKYLSRRC